MTKSDTHPVELARQMISSCQYDLALQIIQAAMESRSDSKVLWETQAMAYYALRDFDAARSSMEAATVLGPLSAEAQYVLADCYDRLAFPLAAACIYEHLGAHVELVPAALLPGLAAKLGALKK